MQNSRSNVFLMLLLILPYNTIPHFAHGSCHFTDTNKSCTEREVGSIDNAIVNVYNNHHGNLCYNLQREDNDIKTILIYTPLSLLNDLTEETNYQAIQTYLNTLDNIPENEAYVDALNTLYTVENNAYDQLLTDETLKEKAHAIKKRWYEAVLNYASYTDEALSDLLIELSIESTDIANAVTAAMLANVDQQQLILSQKINQEIFAYLNNLDTYPCFIRPSLLVDGFNALQKLPFSMEDIIAHGIATLHNQMPLCKTLLTQESIAAAKIVLQTIGKKIVRGLLAKNLGVNHEAYAIKKLQELDTVILQKIITLNLDLTVEQTVQIDTNTTCTITPSVQPILEIPILLICCTTTISQ